MDGDEHILGINWKVLGMLYFNLLVLTPLLSLLITLILFLIFRLICVGRCNFALLIELQSCISQQKRGRLRTGVKGMSGFDICHTTCHICYFIQNICISEKKAVIQSTHRGGALLNLWECRAFQLWVDLLTCHICHFLHVICISEKKAVIQSTHRGGALLNLWECRAFQLWVDLFLIYNQKPIYFQIIVRMFLLHFNLRCSRYFPLALMFTSGLVYIIPQNVLETIILTKRFLILIFNLIIPQKCFIFQKICFMVPQKFIKFSNLGLMDIVGGFAPCGSISSRDIPIRILEFVFFGSQHEDSNYQH